MYRKSLKRTKPRATNLSRKKILLYRCILCFLIVTPFLVLCVIELILHFSSFNDDFRDPYVNISPFSIFSRETINDEEFVSITHRFAYAERKVQFTIRKPANTVRIFVLGGSAAAGWPHQAHQTFSAYIQQALQKTLPEQKVEVINAASHGFASFRVRYIFDEIAGMDPDVILIYSGNNEFIEKREYPIVVSLEWLASRLKSVQWLRSKISQPKSNLPANDLQDVALFFWKKVKRQALDLRKDPEQFEKVKSHYRHTIEYMVRKASEKSIPVLLCTVPVNLRDWLPTVSYIRLTGQQLSEWQYHYNLGRKSLLESRYTTGIEAMKHAIQLEPEHAESHFWLGRLFEGTGRFSEALQSYQRARDLDYNPFRAISPFNETLRSIASRNEKVFLVDLEKTFNETSQTGSPGFDLFLDYVHPNTEGNILIAEKIYNTLKDYPILNRSIAATMLSRGNMEFAKISGGYDDASDIKVQLRLFSLYAINHQYEAAIKQTRKIIYLKTGEELSPNEIMHLDSLSPKIREGYIAFHRYENAQRMALLGQNENITELDTSEKLLNAYYEKHWPYGRF